MRVRPGTSFPYPVLYAPNEDYRHGAFELELHVDETPSTGSVILEAALHLEEASVLKVVESGKAKLGLMITCRETYLDRFHECSFDRIRIDLSVGQVRGTVYVRGVLLATEDGVVLESENIDPEFPMDARIVRKGSFIALTEELKFEAGLEKLARLESIFRLTKAEDLQEGHFVVDFDCEAIRILVPPSLYQTLYNLRVHTMKNLLLPALYLPVVMSALDEMRSGNFSDKRWYGIIKARCEAEGIDVKGDLAAAAQKLLDGPLGLLQSVVELGS